MSQPPEPTAAEVAEDVDAARERIGRYVRTTPLESSPNLSDRSDAGVRLKLENLQVTQSFKARGAFSALTAMSETDRARGVVTSSTGNHANAMAYAMPLLGIEGEIWVPSTASKAKLDQLRARNADLELIDDDAGKVEAMARAEADRSGRIFVSPYNDRWVIAGQGTIAAELLESEPDRLDDVLVPVGGGGLIGGIAGYLKARAPRTKVIGVLPENSPVMAESVAAGRLLEKPTKPSLADATAGWTEPGSITFPMCRDWVDEWLLVTEEQIAEAMRLLIGMHSFLVEGAGALSTAAMLANHDRFEGRKVTLIVSGARVPLDVLAGVLGTGATPPA